MFCAAGCSACYFFFFLLIIDLREARGKVLRFLGALLLLRLIYWPPTV